MAGGVTAVTPRQNWKRSLVYVAIGMALLLAVLFAVSLIFEQSLWDSFPIASAVLTGCLCLGSVVMWIYGHSIRGPVLLDCGAHPQKWLFLGMAVLGLFSCILSASFDVLEPDSEKGLTTGFLFGLCGVFAAVYSLMEGLGRLEIRENGIWAYRRLIKGDSLRSHRWHSDDTLVLRWDSWIPSGGTQSVPVPPEHRDFVKELLGKYYPIDQ